MDVLNVEKNLVTGFISLTLLFAFFAIGVAKADTTTPTHGGLAGDYSWNTFTNNFGLQIYNRNIIPFKQYTEIVL
jgi:hypothetical protein